MATYQFDDTFTAAENRALLKIDLQAGRYHLRLLNEAARAGKFPKGTRGDPFTPAKKSGIARLNLKSARYHLRLLKAAARSGKLPSGKTLAKRLLGRGFMRVFAK